MEDEGHKAETTTPLQRPLGQAWGSQGAVCAQPPQTHAPSAQQWGRAQAPPGATSSVQWGHPAMTGACRLLHPGHRHTCTACALTGPQTGPGSERWLFWGLGGVHCPRGEPKGESWTPWARGTCSLGRGSASPGCGGAALGPPALAGGAAGPVGPGLCAELDEAGDPMGLGCPPSPAAAQSISGRGVELGTAESPEQWGQAWAECPCCAPGL